MPKSVCLSSHDEAILAVFVYGGPTKRASVYAMRMARVNVYLPDDLATRARAAELNVSRLTQAAIQRELDRCALDEWLDEVAALPPTGINDVTALAVITAVRDEFEFGE